MGKEVLKVSNIEKYYGKKGNVTKAINDISFTVSEGEFVGIMGASGSGKTTLLNCISTIDKDFNLLDTLTAYENIALALTIQRVNNKEIDKRVRLVAEALNISNELNKYPYEMSGGQKQRVAIARALMRHPAILLADEPVASLDPVTGRQILGLLKSIHATDGVTILMNSHNLEFSQEFSDRLIGLKDGKVVFDGKTADLTDSITTQIYNKNDTQIENKRGVAYE